MRFREELSIALNIDKQAADPLYRQLSRQIEDSIKKGSLPRGTRVPATRTLAGALGVSRTVAITAYLDLFAKGYLVGQHGSGTYVAGDIARSDPLVRSKRAAEGGMTPALDFSPGRVSTENFPLDAWRAAWRHAAHNAPDTQPLPTAGLSELRDALAAHLKRNRGLACSADNIVITTGVRHSLELLACATTTARPEVVMEEPGSLAVRHALQARGLRVVCATTDREGISASGLPMSAGMIVTTPSHQFPAGGSLSLARRVQLLSAAQASGALLVEDDTGAEFLHGGAPLPSLAHMSALRGVAHVGTLSTLMTAALGIGYLVTSEDLALRVTDILARTSESPPSLAQHAAVELLSGGHINRHLSRTRQLLRTKRNLVSDAFTPLTGHGRLHGLHAGLHAIFELHDEIPAHVAQKLLSAKGVRVPTLSEYYATPRRARNALVIGYSGHEQLTLRRGLELITSTLRSVTSGSSSQAA